MNIEIRADTVTRAVEVVQSGLVQELPSVNVQQLTWGNKNKNTVLCLQGLLERQTKNYKKLQPPSPLS